MVHCTVCVVYIGYIIMPFFRVYDVKRCVDACMITASIATNTSGLSLGTLTGLVTIMKRCISAATAYSVVWSNATSTPRPVDDSKGNRGYCNCITVEPLYCGHHWDCSKCPD